MAHLFVGMVLVGRELSLILDIRSVLTVRPDTIFIRMGVFLATRPGHYIYYDRKCPCPSGQTLHLLGREVSLLLRPYTAFIMLGHVLAIRAGDYIYYEGKFACY